SFTHNDTKAGRVICPQLHCSVKNGSINIFDCPPSCTVLFFCPICRLLLPRSHFRLLPLLGDLFLRRYENTAMYIQ
ncbi:hypothetical protein X975_16237, partial [Stegodyphus mimosarum]